MTERGDFGEFGEGEGMKRLAPKYAHGWRVATVNQLVGEKVLDKPLDGNHGEKHPKGADFVTSGIPFIMASNINNGKIDTIECSFITKDQADSLDKGFSITGDVLLTHKATLGRTAIVGNIQTPYIMLTPQVTYYRILKSETLYNKFLKYYFDSPFFQETFANYGDSGSTRSYVGITAQGGLPILLPTFHEQKAIAAVLSSLDDKIDLLHRQNATLEAMAEALFRQWFVVEAKEEWEIGLLGSLFEIASGKGLKQAEFSEAGQYPVLGANGQIGTSNSFLYCEKLIYTGRVGTLGNLFIIDNEKVWLSDNTLIFTNILSFYFVYFLLKSQKLQELNVGSTQPLIRQSDIKEIEIIIPPKELLEKFEKTAQNFFDKIQFNKTQISSLEKLRDILLPKLMSGEVRVQC